MLISTKGRYALRVMIDLAQCDTGEYIPLGEIAARQEISEKYLESIIAVLVKAGFLAGLRGKGGGYKLTRSPEQYTAGSILRLTEGTLAPVACLSHGNTHCERSVECKTLPLWEKLAALIDDCVDGVTLSELAGNPAGQNNYFI